MENSCERGAQQSEKKEPRMKANKKILSSSRSRSHLHIQAPSPPE